MNIRKYLSDDTNRVRCSSLQVNDLASLLCGVKSVVYASVSDAAENRLVDQLCSDLKLEKVLLGRTRDIADSRVVDLLIGPDHAKLVNAKKHYSDVCSLEWGLSLDYPECCVTAYRDWRFNHAPGDLVKYVYSRTPKGKILPFWMNNTLNFFSRINSPAMRRDYLAFSKLNAGQDREAFLTWHPCSYSCPATLKKGKTVFEFMRKYMPRTTAARRKMLSSPVIFWDKFMFAILNGGCRRERNGISLEYKGVLPPRALLGAGVLNSLSSGGSLHISEEGEIKVPRRIKLPGGFVVLPFSC